MKDEYKKYFERLREVTANLQTKFNNSFTDVYEVIEKLENNPTDEEIATSLQELQNINDKLFESHGICDEIIDFQVCINKLRNYADINDPKEVVVREDGSFVQ